MTCFEEIPGEKTNSTNEGKILSNTYPGKMFYHSNAAVNFIKSVLGEIGETLTSTNVKEVKWKGCTIVETLAMAESTG